MPLNLLDPSMTKSDFNEQQLPIGAILVFCGATVPKGWFLCNGASYSQLSYAALFGAIGTTFGGAGGNFNVPTIADLGGNNRQRYIIKALRYDP
jgi:microcystin-dependent protein